MKHSYSMVCCGECVRQGEAWQLSKLRSRGFFYINNTSGFVLHVKTATALKSVFVGL
jgi:hypothetical protein